jgi:serine/threonine protein kinase
MTLSPGARLGPYEILSPLGAGGMGEVYKARDTRLERTVAVKVLPSHMSASQEVRQRFPSRAGPASGRFQPRGGSLPRWRGDGRELYFLSVDNKLMAAPVNADKTFHAGSPAPLFAVHPNLSSSVFDVTSDGQRFLVNSLPADLSSPPLTLIANWPATLAKKK